MAYISPPRVAVGDPVRRTDYNLVADDLDVHEARIVSLEAVGSVVVVFDEIINNASSFATLTGILYWRSPIAFTLTEARIAIFTKGSLTGTLQCDVKKNTSLNPAGFGTVFTTKPSIVYASVSDYAISSNAVYDNTAKAVAAGSYLRFDITQIPAGGVISKFVFTVFGEI